MISSESGNVSGDGRLHFRMVRTTGDTLTPSNVDEADGLSLRCWSRLVKLVYPSACAICCKGGSEGGWVRSSGLKRWSRLSEQRCPV